jgi:phosphomannomutase
MFHLEGGGRVIVRPSGTEPKVKVYLQSVVGLDRLDLKTARSKAAENLQSMAAAAASWLK